MNEDIVAIVMIFSTIIALGLGIPLIVGWNSRRMAALQQAATRPDPALDERLGRIETAVDAMAIELERIAEGQRFVTRLLSEQKPAALPVAAAAPVAADVRAAAAPPLGG